MALFSDDGEGMADLVFHLGLTKTGSSFLQKRVFQGKMNTFERALDWEVDSEQALSFQNFFLQSSLESWREDSAKNFFGGAVSDSKSNVLISHESLFEHIPFTSSGDRLTKEPELLASRLAAINEHCWSSGSVKAFFFFRRQADWLASMYAHVAYAIKNPSQADFERTVRQLITPESEIGHILEYDRLYDALVGALGVQNVLALPYERFSDKETWDLIEAFSGIDGLYQKIPFSDNSVNRKRQGEGAGWQPGGRRLRIAGFQINSVLKRLMRGLLGPSLTESILKSLRPKWQLKMSDNLRDEIMRSYEASNRKMAERCKYNLSEVGYY